MSARHGEGAPARRASGVIAALRRTWGRIGLRWQLVALNAVVIGATVTTILLLMDRIAEPSFMSIMHAAGQPVDPAAGQRAYDAAVAGEVYPTIILGAAVALILNFLFVTLAVRPLRAVRAAAESLASGEAPAPIETSRRDEIGNVAESVNDLARSLKRLEDLRRQVTNDVAHELRTPLHNLLGLLEGMRDGVIPATPEQVDRAHHELSLLICSGGGPPGPLRRPAGPGPNGAPPAGAHPPAPRHHGQLRRVTGGAAPRLAGGEPCPGRDGHR